MANQPRSRLLNENKETIKQILLLYLCRYENISRAVINCIGLNMSRFYVPSLCIILFVFQAETGWLIDILWLRFLNLLEPFLNIAFRFIKIIGLRCAVKIIFCLGFPFAKPFLQFLWKKTQIFAFVALHFCAKKIALCAIIRKLDFAQNCAIPLLCYSVLRNF